MTQFTKTGRLGAAALAAIGWLGLIRYVAAETRSQEGDWIGAIWANLGFLTDLSNLLLAVVMTGVALGVRPLSRPHVVGWAVAAIATVGLGFWVIGGRLTFGRSALEDILLHGVTPWAALLFWVVLAPKGGLSWRKAAVWLGWPLGYFAYALIRGRLSGEYAYAFLDPGKASAASIAMTIAMIAAIFAVWGVVLLGMDRLMGGKAA